MIVREDSGLYVVTNKRIEDTDKFRGPAVNTKEMVFIRQLIAALQPTSTTGEKKVEGV